MHDILRDIEGLRPFIRRSLERYRLVDDKIAYVRHEIDQIMELQMRDPAGIEPYIRNIMIKQFAEKVSEKVVLVRNVTPEGTNYNGHVCILSVDELREVIEKSIVAVLKDAIAFEANWCDTMAKTKALTNTFKEGDR